MLNRYKEVASVIYGLNSFVVVVVAIENYFKTCNDCLWFQLQINSIFLQFHSRLYVFYNAIEKCWVFKTCTKHG